MSNESSVVLVEGVPVPAKLAAAFRDRRDPSKTPFSYTAPLPPSVAVPVSKTRLSIPRVLPIVPPELLQDSEPEESADMTHMQYNSPMPLYSRESAEEQYRQQIGHGGGNVPHIGSSEKHFDPEKSATLRAIQEQEMDDNFGKNFFEKVAAAEAPKVPIETEPSWASQARERSERARSHTPGAAQRQFQAPQPGAIPMPLHPMQPPSVAIPLGPPTLQYNNPTSEHNNPSHQYYSPRSNYGAVQSDKVVPERGYQFGGLDFTDKSAVQDDGSYQPYYQSRPKTPVRQEKPGYKMGGTDFAESAHIHQQGYNPNYHGHGPDPPRLRSVFSADPHAPVNSYVSPNVEAVNPIRLVGDTISNQKAGHEQPISPEQKANMGTSFAPPAGHRPEHRTVQPPPKQPEPLCYSLSAKKGRGGGGYYGSQVRAQSAAPGLNREEWTAEKEVNVETLLNDEALRPIRRSMTPDWAGRSQQKHDSWRHTLDPRLDRPQIFRTEPNWSRTVHERRNAWEHQAANTEARVNLPASAKVPPQQPPYWANKANSTHRIWQTAADRNLMQGGQQQYGGGAGGYGTGGYTTQQSGYDYSSQQQQQQQQQQYDYYSQQQSYQQQQQQQKQQQQQQAQYQPQQNGYSTGEQQRTYSYASQQAPAHTTPLQMDSSSFTTNKVTTTKETTTAPQTQAIALPAPPSSGGGQYQQYSSSEKRFEKRTQEHTQEERVTQPAQHYEEQRDYQRSYRKETSEQRTVQPTVQPIPQSQVQSTTISKDAFDRRAEMNETLPRGSLSNTQANAAGAYVDQEGRNVSYKRELTTSADPGKEYQLLKEEESRVVEQPLEPGVISRHVTTKYYKKKTVTDTQQTTVQ